ncbi:FAD:protein FMN transferase [Solirubrobacter phytolaccae]|uniref:FAD:protein FMN transferase n=1 Tax=Solirubrobacter phytolaccae TaxID=1404360 RepID=A0A9X3N6B3_9ACTN|nr:FAD:protein FMN transferase [Solirubrobacter phytolaccae]MDA0180640.1 FAD:protein FMN transferase [Solirubrobacter phytolaccae]
MRFDCFGSRCGVWGGDELAARRRLEAWHRQFSRFRPDSELSRLNRDPREVVPISADMARLLTAIHDAAAATGGLVDGTLLHEIEAAGYRTDLGTPVPLDVALALAPPRQPARPRSERPGFTLIRSLDSFFVRRPPGLAFDSGGLAKGLFADLLAEAADGPLAVDCGGDLRFAGRRRTLEVTDPFGGPGLHVFEVHDGAVATSGIGTRSWLDAAGRPAHHLLDPATGWPAFTGVVQATALAPTAVEAEWRAKATLLSADPSWLVHGGLVVLDDGRHELVPARSRAAGLGPNASKVQAARGALMT